MPSLRDWLCGGLNRGAVTFASLGFQPEVLGGDDKHRPAAEWRQVIARCFRLSSLRDLGGAGGVTRPWVETQGYRMPSLRDWLRWI
ncbi:hypothetical protein RISK_004904 [Rhodopirellula islandica]|uniref:Uncharacterized protein n=1 Tax=Rhodopirellula islandica TaxID=595434 RepID=A0A0J1B9D2_RHOIS|nr:hypothetical protein [Rhodopirellula islandica]KLU03138.1 hypothetical protein RISK_004904 [Rhodopirellula islandica]